MYITCEKCKTSFIVRDGQIGPDGRKVRCSKCKHMWYAEMILSKTHEEEPIEIIPEASDTSLAGIHLPSVRWQEKKETSSDWVMILIMFLLFSSIIFYMKDIGKIFLDTRQNNLTLSDLKIYREPNSDKITVYYTTTNDGKDAVEMSDLCIKILDDQNNLLKTYTMSIPKVIFEPSKEMRFKTEFLNIPPSAAVVDISKTSKLNWIL